jgi:hypothetical protein
MRPPRPPRAPSPAFPPRAVCDGMTLFSAIWHSIAQSRGLSQGVYFDRWTMRPLVQTAAFKAAARLFIRVWTRALPEPDGYCSFSNPGLRLGQCAISIGTFEQVKVGRGARQRARWAEGPASGRRWWWDAGGCGDMA